MSLLHGTTLLVFHEFVAGARLESWFMHECIAGATGLILYNFVSENWGLVFILVYVSQGATE